MYKISSTSADLLDGSGAPEKILLIPAGHVPTRPHDKRPGWNNPDAAAVVANTSELQLDLPIDYEHQTQYSKVNGQPAPAAGWIKRVYALDGEVWGDVLWTDKAKKHISKKEYRYVSASFEFNAQTRVIHRIVGAGLTNNPAFFMPAIAGSNSPEEESMPKTLKEVLDLDGAVGEEGVIKAAQQAMDAKKAMIAIAVAFALPESTKPEAVSVAAIKHIADLRELAGVDDGEISQALASIKSAVDPINYVPRAEFNLVQGKYKTLLEATSASTSTASVDAAIKEGKITPASRDWALGYAKKDPAGFGEFVAAAPVVVAPGSTLPLNKTNRPGVLTSAEKAVCRAMGIDEKDFLAGAESLKNEDNQS